ncbi:MAG: SGNH/GDSL hydrolase family protein [Clostridia bacterium]|nr:SGNH/GDSL hydrolase family protein [Clostridia bacterium]
MKKFLNKLAVPLACILLTSCTMTGGTQADENDSSTASEPIEYSKLLEYDKFNLETYMQPIWLGDTVYNETVVFVGQDDLGRLLYPVDEIISVTSYDLKTTYQEGVDYVFDEKHNAIALTEKTSMPFFYEAGYYPQTGTFHSYSRGTGLFFSEGDYFSKKHVAITYRAKKDDRLTSPTDFSSRYSDLLAKMSSGENVKICFYGDSITVGGNGSGFLGIEPNMPGFDALVTDSLKKIYGNQNISFVNHAKGGEATLWGYNNVTLVTDENPDLVIMAWGMNDLGISDIRFKQQLTWIIDAIKEKCPNTEILLVSSMLPNGDAEEFHVQNDYENCKLVMFEVAQSELAEEYGLGLATVTTMHKEILRYKTYYSMTGNNVNHPTDFIIRVYAQNILYALTGKTL